ncbi:hypothetical protein F4820DRAFT_430997 [Hypoxylon rubiginosum]|uniref:Uncharacterized protein n=1 Tax=Hypoxylon rubiginosum TaxID=110542 RepID=A0ACB9YTJ3_9PEZI|nr:hypothetical protein F4820DRAFT_430997 [Hypoxylon rubiginosum]
MAYQPPNAYYSQGHPIYLYTAPLEYQKHVFNFTKPRDAIGHWAVCVQGQCYELAKNRDNDKKKKDPKYKVNWLPEDVWKAGRQPCKKSDPIGYTERPWPPQTIQYICGEVWRRPLQGKYVYDENNCQVFVRLLVDLIGDKQTQAQFPASFDIWSKRMGITRDSTVLIATAGIATVAAAASLVATPVDVTGTAAAGFAVSASMVLRSTTALFNDRASKEMFIKKAQAELREELTRQGIFAY